MSAFTAYEYPVLMVPSCGDPWVSRRVAPSAADALALVWMEVEEIMAKNGDTWDVRATCRESWGVPIPIVTGGGQ